MTKSKSYAFTLPEVLITIVIIGIISVLVITPVIMRIDGFANKRAQLTFYKKIGTSVQMMQSSNALVGYDTTEDFIDNLKKYIKTGKICDNSKLTECFNGSIKSFNGDKELKIKNGMKLSDLKSDYDKDTNVMAVILQDGTNILMAYNTDCAVSDPKSLTPNLACLSMIFDINGRRAPNRISLPIANDLTLSTKEDNSNISQVRDVGLMNADNFGDVPKITEKYCQETLGGSTSYIANNCVVDPFKNNLNYTESLNWCQNNVHPNFVVPNLSQLQTILSQNVMWFFNSKLTMNPSLPCSMNYNSSDTSGNIIYYVANYGDNSYFKCGLSGLGVIPPGTASSLPKTYAAPHHFILCIAAVEE